MKFFKKLAALSALIAVSAVSVKVESREISLYAGEALSKLNVTTQSLGSGYATESSQPGNISDKSIQLVTQGLYAGAVFVFANPVEIADPSELGNMDYLAFTLRFTAVTPLGLQPAGDSPFASREYVSVSSDRFGNYDDFETLLVPKARRFRVVLQSSDGKVAEHVEPIVVKPIDEEGWITVAVPLAAFGIKAPGKGFRLSRLTLSADYPDTIYIGQIRVVTDDSPVTVEEIPEQSVGPYDNFVLFGQAEAGITSLIYSWDFNDADGIQEDATGRIVQTTYKKSGNYNVTLTARDPNGIKKEASTKIAVEVF